MTSSMGKKKLPVLLLHAHPDVKKSYCERKLVSITFCLFLSLPLSKSMDAVVQVLVPPHIGPVQGGSDHIWILLLSLDAHYRSQNQVVCGVVVLRGTHTKSLQTWFTHLKSCFKVLNSVIRTSYWSVSSMTTASLI